MSDEITNEQIDAFVASWADCAVDGCPRSAAPAEARREFVPNRIGSALRIRLPRNYYVVTGPAPEEIIRSVQLAADPC